MSALIDAPRLSRLEDLRALEPDWWDLWRRDRRATPFQSPAWLIPWWETFAPGDLHVRALRRDGALVALAPLYVERGETDRLLPIGISISDSLDILAQDESAAQTLMDALLRDAPCGRLDLEALPESAHARHVETAWSMRESPCDTCPWLPISPGWDAHIPARKRRQWRRAVRAAQRHGDFTIEDGAADVPAFLAELECLHGARWRTRDEDGVLADPRVQAFHRSALPRLVDAGLARLALARFAGRVAGAYYGLAARDRAYAYIGGFDPECAAESPGSILIAHAMQDAQARGATRFEFLRGDEAYKYAWGARDAPCLRRTLERA